MTASACSKCLPWCLAMISSPPPTVNRRNGTKGFSYRMRFTSWLLACLTNFRAASVLRRKLSRIMGSTRLTGSIFFGARARAPPGFGAIYVRMNHRLNQPRVISSTGRCGRLSKAAESSGTMVSFPTLRWSRHWPILQAPCLGCQFSCEGVSPVATDSARRSAVSNSARMRDDHFGKPESSGVDTRQNNKMSPAVSCPG